MKREEFITERTRIISEMLDNPNKYGIYPTTKCFEQLDALYDSLSLPPAEGAKTRETCGACKWQYAKYEYKCEDCRAGKNNYELEQPTAEGAEAIQIKVNRFLADNGCNSSTGYTTRAVAYLLERFATLNAQKIADKMYADTEADGYVFCGKCGKVKEVLLPNC